MMLVNNSVNQHTTDNRHSHVYGSRAKCLQMNRKQYQTDMNKLNSYSGQLQDSSLWFMMYWTVCVCVLPVSRCAAEVGVSECGTSSQIGHVGWSQCTAPPCSAPKQKGQSKHWDPAGHTQFVVRLSPRFMLWLYSPSVGGTAPTMSDHLWTADQHDDNSTSESGPINIHVTYLSRRRLNLQNKYRLQRRASVIQLQTEHTADSVAFYT